MKVEYRQDGWLHVNLSRTHGYLYFARGCEPQERVRESRFKGQGSDYLKGINMRIGRRISIVTLAGLCFCGSLAFAGGKTRRIVSAGHDHGSGPCYEHAEGETHFDREKTLKQGEPFVAKRNPYLECEHTLERAGFPNRLGSQALPTVTPYYCGDYVGGGAAYVGREPRRRNEGTWGWDYTGGRLLPGRIFLDWSHGRRYQGGTGRYQTDPNLEVPNIFANKLSGLHHKAEPKEEE